jgi:predicted  nucleic acid-binding Zn-ribbon protein
MDPIRKAFNKVKEDIQGLQKELQDVKQTQTELQKQLEEFRSREDTAYSVEKQAEELAKLQQRLEEFDE